MEAGYKLCLRKPWVNIGKCRVYSNLMPPVSKAEAEELDKFLEAGDWKGAAYWLEEKFGSYAFIYEHGDKVVAGVDAVAVEPLFYHLQGQKLLIGDDLRKFPGSGDKAPLFARAEVVMVGFVTGEETLVKGVKQILSGKCHVFSKREGGWDMEKVAHTTFLTSRYDLPDMDAEEFLAGCTKVWEKVVSRTLERVGDRQIALPLSGGLDSRTLALMFRQAGKENVVCYTYGKQGNQESMVSKSIAKVLGYKWEFAHYTPGMWTEWDKSPATKEWLDCCFLGRSCIPHINDLPALDQFFQRRVFEEDAVFIPGHILGTLAGIFTPDLKNYRDSEACFNATFNDISEKYFDPGLLYGFYPDLDTEGFYGNLKNKLRAWWPDWSLATVNGYAEVFYNWGERQSKFNASSVQFYLHRGHHFALPWCDGSIVRFLEKVPHQHRLHRRMYRKWLEKRGEGILPVSPVRNSPIHKVQRAYRKWIPKPLRKIRYKIWPYLYYRIHPMEFFSTVPYKDFKRLHKHGFHINNWIAYKYLEG